MPDDNNRGPSPTIVAAVIALVGVLGAAVINNWDKLFPPHPSGDTTAMTSLPATTGTATTGAATTAARSATGHRPHPAAADRGGDASPPPVASVAGAPVAMDDKPVTRAWQEVLDASQRRTDLIPDLVATAVGANPAAGPAGQQVQSARAGLSVSADAQATDPDAVKRFQGLQKSLNLALAQLFGFARAANNPNLDAELNQVQGADNRMVAAIENYNRLAASYNAAAGTRRFALYPSIAATLAMKS